MFKKILIGVISLVLIVGMTACSGTRDISSLPLNVSGATTIEKSEEESKAVPASTVIQNALNGRYKRGDKILVSGEISMKYLTRPLALNDVVYQVGPEYQGFYVLVMVEDVAIGGWIKAVIDTHIIVRGTYDGFYEVKELSQPTGEKGPVLINTELVSK